MVLLHFFIKKKIKWEKIETWNSSNESEICPSFTHQHMTGSRHHTQCPLKAEAALRVPSSILLLMRKHRNTVKKNNNNTENHKPGIRNLSHKHSSQTQALGAVRQRQQAQVTTRQKQKAEMLLHVFGERGNRGVLDLSRIASRNSRFVSEDLEN